MPTRFKSLLAVALLLCMQPAARAADHRPNLILAIADDWGYPHAGAYGYKAAKTPTFDRLATQGMLFSRAYCAAPSCTASRGSISRDRRRIAWKMAATSGA